MAHNLEMVNGRGQMFSVRQVPWHKLGKILDNPPTSKEAIIEAGLDWRVNPTDIYFQCVKEDQSPSPITGIVEPTFEKFEGKKALVRSSDGNPLSIVSDHYKPLQNHEAFEWFDPIVDEGKATYETAGSLQNGKKIWILAKLKDNLEVVSGDEVRRYILLANGHDGLTGIMIQPTPIRVVCENTLNASLGTGNVSTIWHHGDVKDKMERVKRLLGVAEKHFEERKEVYKAMAKHNLNQGALDEYVKAVVLEPNEEATDRVKESVKNSRDRIKRLHESGFGANIKGVRGTMWGAYNAAVEFGEYDMPQRVRDLGNYQLFGLGAQFKQRAFDTAVEMMEA